MNKKPIQTYDCVRELAKLRKRFVGKMEMSVDYALVGSVLFLMCGHPNLQLNQVAAVVAAWGVLFILLPGVQKSRLQTIGCPSSALQSQAPHTLSGSLIS